MNRDQTAEAVEIMSAWLEGKTIQATSRNQGHGYWSSCNPESTIWAFDRFDYRIAPEPMEIEVWVSPHEELSFVKPHSIGNLIWIKKTFREVL